MPSFVTVVGFVAEGVTTSEEADALQEFFDRAADHTDRTLPEHLGRLLADRPTLQVWALTAGEDEDTLALHVVKPGRATRVDLDPRVVRPRRRARPPRGWPRLGPTEIAEAILGRSDPFGVPLSDRDDWYARLTAADPQERAAALAAAKRIVTGRRTDEARRARRRGLVGPLVRALRDGDEALRGGLWDIACWMNAEAIREVTLDALRSGDPTLSDDHVERQRALVFEVLPAVVGAAKAETPAAPWIARAEAILARYDLAPTPG